jgi:hypothetical protein
MVKDDSLAILHYIAPRVECTSRVAFRVRSPFHRENKVLDRRPGSKQNWNGRFSYYSANGFSRNLA